MRVCLCGVGGANVEWLAANEARSKQISARPEPSARHKARTMNKACNVCVCGGGGRE